MTRRAQINLQVFGEGSQELRLAVTDTYGEVDFEALFGTRERTTLFMPEAVLTDSCLFWLDAGIDRVVRVSTRTDVGTLVVRVMLGQEATHLGHILHAAETRQSTDFADCVVTPEGLHVTGREFETATLLGNIAEKLAVARGLNCFEIMPVPSAL